MDSSLGKAPVRRAWNKHHIKRKGLHVQVGSKAQRELNEVATSIGSGSKTVHQIGSESAGRENQKAAIVESFEDDDDMSTSSRASKGRAGSDVDVERIREELQQEHNKQLSEFQKSLLQKESQLEELQLELAEVSSFQSLSPCTPKTPLSREEELVQRLKASHAKAAASDLQMGRLQLQVDRLEERLSARRVHSDKQSQETSARAAEMAADIVKSAKAAQAKAEEEAQELRARFTEAQTSLDDKQQELEKSKAALRETNLAASNASEALEAAEEREVTLTTNLKLYKRDTEADINRLDKLRENEAKARVLAESRLEQEKQDGENQLTALQAKCAGLEASLTSLTAGLEEEREKRHQCEKDLRGETERSAGLHTELATERHLREAVEGSLHLERARLEEVDSIHRAEQEQHKAVEEEATLKRQEIEQLQAALNSEQSRCEAAEAAVTEAAGHLEIHVAKCAKLEAELEEERRDCKLMENKIGSMESEKLALQEEIAEGNQARDLLEAGLEAERLSRDDQAEMRSNVESDLERSVEAQEAAMQAMQAEMNAKKAWEKEAGQLEAALSAERTLRSEAEEKLAGAHAAQLQLETQAQAQARPKTLHRCCPPSPAAAPLHPLACPSLPEAALPLPPQVEKAVGMAVGGDGRGVERQRGWPWGGEGSGHGRGVEKAVRMAVGWRRQWDGLGVEKAVRMAVGWRGSGDGRGVEKAVMAVGWRRQWGGEGSADGRGVEKAVGMAVGWREAVGWKAVRMAVGWRRRWGGEGSGDGAVGVEKGSGVEKAVGRRRQWGWPWGGEGSVDGRGVEKAVRMAVGWGW
ncbi:hypothetical protein CYMTET_38803 [Cymbomonas tetramitiformis]|uniref:Uncharacterized protein n=1 Tax=Cymbomonas tetramitiformis TaxID=36881 RepID=A0AAE0CBB7_9CHLO|nr:hypothetical protein CYMTET_38803 [Cymbomonas tetramitiformis]